MLLTPSFLLSWQDFTRNFLFSLWLCGEDLVAASGRALRHQVSTQIGGAPRPGARRKHSPNRFLALGLLAIFALGGCAAVGPDYTRPLPDAPAHWNSPMDDGLSAQAPDPATLAEWWKTLQDPTLDQLIKRAVAGNLDLRQARARVREARAQRGISRSKLFPQADSSASVTDGRTSENSGLGKEDTLYMAGFDAGWELDVFGGVRRAVEAAQADLEASRETLADVLVTLLGEVALNYMEARTYQTRLDVAEANTKAQQRTYDLIRSRFQAGLSDELAVQQARYNLESTRSQIPNLQTGLEESKNRLAVLLATPPGSVHEILAKRRPIPVTPVSVAVGVPAETLRHRPDIRVSERNLAAQTARIGQATAELYPKFRLDGFIGLESLSSSDLFTYGSRAWTIGPTVSWRIFDGGAIRQNIEVQNARQEQALIQYEATVLNALEEVENALVAYAQEQLRRDSLEQATTAAERAVLLAGDRYKAGLVDFSNVLDAQRSLLSFQDELARSKGAVTGNLVRIYKALGGGWESLPPGRNP